MGTRTSTVLAQLIGRNQGPEFFVNFPFVALSSPFANKNVNLNRPLERLHFIFRGRVTIAGANYDAVAAEAPQTILQRVRLEGDSTVNGSQTLIDMSGASIFALPRLLNQRGSSVYINGVRQPEPSVPFQQVGATFGNIGTYDLEIHYDYVFTPIFPPGLAAVLTPFLLQKSEWQDSLQLQVFFGDETSFGTPNGATTVTFSAFGSGAGSPTLTVETNYEINGVAAGSFPTGVVLRTEKAATGDVTTVSNNISLFTLQKRKTTNVIIKTGSLLAGTNPGVQVFSDLSDTILDFTQIRVDNKPIRNIQNNFAAKEYYGYAFGTVLPEGYLNLSFIDSQNPLTFFRGDTLDKGVEFEVNTNVISNGASQTANVIQEQVLGNPQGGG
jgi:hypothetical protein